MLPRGSRSDGVPSYVGATRLKRVAEDGKLDKDDTGCMGIITPNQSGVHC
jgi:hypothetical protein